MKILIAKANQLGDNLVFLPVFQELLRHCRAKDLYLLTSPIASALYRGLIPEENLWVKPTREVLDAWKRPGTAAGFLRRWRRIRPDAALLPFDQGNVPRFMAWLARTPLRTGAVNPEVKTNALLTHRLDFDERTPVAIAEWRLGRLLAKTLGHDELFRQIDPPAPDLCHLTGPVQRDPRSILIHPAASLECKRWPAGRFVQLANRLSDRYRILWAESALPEQSELSRSVTRIPRGGLPDFVRTLAGCGLFIGNNSGPMNLASAVDVPSVIFAGPALRRWDPFWRRDRNLILRSPSLACQPCALPTRPLTACGNTGEPMACMLRWSVDQVERLVDAHWLRCRGGSRTNRRQAVAELSR